MAIKITANLNRKCLANPRCAPLSVVKTGDSAEHRTNLNKCHLMLNGGVI